MENLPIPQATSPLAAWLHYLERLHAKPIDLGLERVSHVATGLNLLRPAPWVITVGGTNGKGTTCRLLEAILLASGMRVGVYSSPHLLRYTERVRIQGDELPEAAHSEAMAVIETGRGATSLSYFEFGTLAALQLFRQASLDVVILEVGLGGRLDATNIVDADVAVITSIALDHTDWLGPDRASIAREKAGIFRRGRPAIVGESDRPATLDAAAADSGAVLYARDRDWWWHHDGQHWRWWDGLRELTALPLPAIPLENAATAVTSVGRLPFAVPESAVRQGLREASLPGRFQCIGRAPLTILDVAHNPHAAGYLARRLAALPRTGKVRAVIGMLADKDIAGTLACLRGQVDVWYCASLDGPRAASAAQLAAHLDSDAQRFEDVLSARHQAIADAVPEDCVLVFGSFHTVAPVMALAEREKYCGE
ncbi:Dihydrofolate synthase / Folylpolyglutamate synthase [Candidatus Sodalis pierantonius str. SOPE]|uniref:Dihydrofolate synthase/folylpolyglutamate synthase n=1 Tax=Candidatus Sodalis pierantonii str. SOPE TaxID=2342 RepID=W0HKS7_9GAMM|nr:bifunctional tetrahydrofolate synthase/dihydrofolate synthase [Candidatus Sodalis pierantonius]AHF74419.1 Dihydrofolate synthase / Folylpolyglutamate synthase [Candidatus Sodalis pierantonius str. SOPE]